MACGLWLGSSAYSFLGARIRISLGAWKSVCCIYCVLHGTILCDGLITRLEISCYILCVSDGDLET